MLRASLVLGGETLAIPQFLSASFFLTYSNTLCIYIYVFPYIYIDINIHTNMYCTLQVLHLGWLSATSEVTTIVQVSFFKLSQVSKIIWLSIVDVELAPPCWIRLCCFVVCLVSDQPVFAICKATTASAHQSNLTEASQSLWWNGRTATLPRRWVQGVLQFGFGGVSPASNKLWSLLRFGGKSHVLSLERSLVLSPHLDERVIAARSACSHSSTDKPYARASVWGPLTFDMLVTASTWSCTHENRGL